MQTSGFENIALSKDELSMLRGMRHAAVDVTDENRRAVNGLRRCGFAQVISDRAAITDVGIAYLAYIEQKARETRVIDARYWITTGIAAAALIKSFMPELSAGWELLLKMLKQ